MFTRTSISFFRSSNNLFSRGKVSSRGKAYTKQALAAEKKYELAKKIMSIQYHSQVTTDKVKIKDAFLECYRNLFSEGPETCSPRKWPCLLNRLPHVSDIGTSRLKEPLSVEEVAETINCLPTSKYPGPNGINDEFYKHYKSSVCLMLLEYFRHAYSVRIPACWFLQA